MCSFINICLGLQRFHKNMRIFLDTPSKLYHNKTLTSLSKIKFVVFKKLRQIHTLKKKWFFNSYTVFKHSALFYKICIHNITSNGLGQRTFQRISEVETILH